MFNIVGSGLSDNDISLEGINVCKGSDSVYYEDYTSNLSDGKIKHLSDLVNHSIKSLNRSDLEENMKSLIEESRTKNVSLIVNGDPLLATTHKILLDECKEKGIKTRIVHSISILSALIGESGLDFYRFGGVCTISRWYDDYKPTSFYEKIENNLKVNLHSMVLLDYFPESESTLPIAESIRIMLESEEQYKKGILNKSTKIIIGNNIGTDSSRLILTTLEKAESIDLKGLNTFIIPAEISEVEDDFIKNFYEKMI